MALRILLAAIVFLASAAAPALAQNGAGDWYWRAPLTVGRMGHASATIADQVYVSGGWDIAATRTVHALHRYDPATDAWTQLASNGTASSNFGVGLCVFAGELYQFGGGHGTSASAVAAAWKYAPASDTWTRLADMPWALRYGACAPTVDRIYVIGGLGLDARPVYSAFSSVYIYDPAAGTWSTGPDLPVLLQGASCAVIDGIIYIAGGCPSAAGAASQETYSLDTAAASPAWSTLAPMPLGGRYWAAFGVLNGRLYIAGGQNFGVENESFEYDFANDAWTVLQAAPTYPRYVAGAAFHAAGADRMLVSGGQVDGLVYSTQVLEFVPPSPPSVSNPTQSRPGGSPIPEDGWIGGGTVEFTAQVTEPSVLSAHLEIRLFEISDPAGTVRTVAGPDLPSGVHTVTCGGLSAGTWVWKFRAVNTRGLASPWVEFGTPAHDFHVDLVAPSVPMPIAPSGENLRLPFRHGAPVAFTWTPAIDNRINPLTYEVRVSLDPLFGTVYHHVTPTDTQVALQVTPNVNGESYYWKVRAVDEAGNIGSWSPIKSFTASFNDGINHAAGDGNRACGFAARAKGSGLLGFLILAIVFILRPAR